MVEIKRREGESISSLLYRFSRRVQQSGVVSEVRRRRFYRRKENKRQQRVSAKHRDIRRDEVVRRKKLGIS